MSEQVTESIIVKATPQQVYAILTDFTNYPKFTPEIRSVQRGEGDLTHWEVAGLMGKTIEFDLETTRMDPNQRIGWNTKDHESEITTSGQIVLAELPNHQTNVTITLNYEGGFLANLLQQDPEKKLDLAMRRFKTYVEESTLRGEY